MRNGGEKETEKYFHLVGTAKEEILIFTVRCSW